MFEVLVTIFKIQRNEFPQAERPTPASKYEIKVEERNQRPRSKYNQNLRESHARHRAR